MGKEVWQTWYLRKAWDFVMWAIATVTIDVPAKFTT